MSAFAPSEFPFPSCSRASCGSVQRARRTIRRRTECRGLRKAVVDFCARRLGLTSQSDGVLITAGARPLIYGAYRVLVDPGEHVVFPVPSWNNVHYCQMSGGVAVPVACEAKTSFLPTASMLRGKCATRAACAELSRESDGHRVHGAAARRICDVVPRRTNGARQGSPFVRCTIRCLDSHGRREARAPVALRPRGGVHHLCGRHLEIICSDRLRVGWGVGPAPIIQQMSDLAHDVGAWRRGRAGGDHDALNDDV